MPWSGPGQVGMKRKGMVAAFILGLVFGIAVGPCTFAYMAPMLRRYLQGRLDKPYLRSVPAYRLWYRPLLGHRSGRDITELVQRYMNWSEKSKGTAIVRKICGVLVLLGGIYLIYRT